MRKLCLILALLVCAAPAFAAQDRIEQLDAAIERHKGDPEALKRDLAEADALVAQSPNTGRPYFLRGRILSALGRGGEAIAEYRRAASLSPALGAVAHYNIGTILADQGRIPEAIVEYQEALRLDPGNVDAAYNLGMELYLKDQFGDALKYWSIAQRLTPNDFQVARKMVQAYNALGRYEEAARARDEVLRIRRDGKDANAASVKTWVFDQIVLPAGRIFAREPFDADGPIYTFQVDDAKANRIGGMTFLATAKGFVLRVDGDTATSAEVVFATRPAWRELRDAVRTLGLTLFRRP